MSRPNNPAAAVYKNMDIENMEQGTPVKSTGLLGRTSKNNSTGLDLKNPAVRVAKQLQVIRKHRNEINGLTD
jgi:hypothetical protein|tara:strand:- start:5850 stop:6065 length:216 start_codon:yes stop_codon:yes gene_type:complete